MMTVLSDPQLKQGSPADLIALVRALLVRVDTPVKENQKLREVREATHLDNQTISPSPDLALNGFHRRVAEIANQLDRRLECALTDPDETRLQNRLQIYRQKLLTFLDSPGVPPTNNASEQTIRISVIHRKVTKGFRSDWGAKASADLLSGISTSKIKGTGVLRTLVNMMGPEVLPWLNT